jgi:hypothetical protein
MERIQRFKEDLPNLPASAIVQRHITQGECFALDGGRHVNLKTEVGTRFGVHPNEVLVVGSAKLGFSIAPQKRYQPFRDRSDSDLLTVLVELHFTLFKENKDLYSSAVRGQLNQFYNEVDNRQRLEMTVPASVWDEYFRASVQATNDRLNRVRRGEKLQRVITGKSFDSLVEGQD